MTLYEINEAILSCVDEETGEIIDDDKLAELQLTFDEKIEGIALWIKNLLAEAKMVKEEKDNLYARQKACENKAESLKSLLVSALDGEKFKTSKVSISYRKSESVEVGDISKLDDDYLKYADPIADKAKIKKALKDGIELQGARLVEKQNIQIR